MFAKILICISIFVLINVLVHGGDVNDVILQRLANLEDDIENRVAKLEELAKIGTLREAFNKFSIFNS